MTVVECAVEELRDSCVISEQQSVCLLSIVDRNLYNETSNKSDVFSYVVLMMLKHNTYTMIESTPIRQALRELINDHSKEFNQLLGGNDKIVGFFIGRAMKKLGQNYNPKDIQRRLFDMVEEERGVYVWENLYYKKEQTNDQSV